MYFKTPNHSVAVVPKAGSASLALAIVSAFYPEQRARIDAAHYPEGRSPESTSWHVIVPKEVNPSMPVVMVARDPVERFRSACAFMMASDVDAVLDSLEGGSPFSGKRGRKIDARRDEHFSRQEPLATEGATVFSMDDIELAAQMIGLESPMIRVNEGTAEKPTLTPEQESRVLAHYADDKAFYDAIPQGGMVYARARGPQEPTPSSVTATQIRIWLVRNGIALVRVSEAIAAIGDPQARSEAEILWEYAPTVERSHPMTAAIAEALGMDGSEMDRAFREAALL